MIAVDTNVLVRFMTADHPAQYRVARKLFDADSLFIADTVLLECAWVLRKAFSYAPTTICAALRQVCGLPNVSLRDAALVAQALDWSEAGLDFADAMHLAAAGDLSFRTFDRDLLKAGRKLGRKIAAA